MIIIVITEASAHNAYDILDDIAFIQVTGSLKDSNVPLDYLVKVFSDPSVQTIESVVDKFNQPQERKDYSEYRKLFVNKDRISKGLGFYKHNRKLIYSVSKRYGIDPFLLVSIVGVESDYGYNHRQFPVFSALYTVIHQLPRRSGWATNELAELVRYCYNENINPHSINGSYAGAFGYGQFIPSSFNQYAIDFDGDGHRKPYEWPDVLGSIANYLLKHGYDSSGNDFSKTSKNWKAIWYYNHSDNYVRAILELREKIKARLDE